MNIIYNNFDDISSNLENFLEKLDYKLSKPKIKTISNIIISMIKSENITTPDISKVFNTDIYNDSFNLESIEKKIWRLFNNKNFDGISFYNSFIKYIINNISSIRHDKIIVIFDHMYVRNNFVVLMFSLKIGNQGFPIFFKCDKTKSNRHREIDEINKKCLFSQKVIFDAINDVVKLLKPLNSKITFLADRWFCNLKLMEYINNLGHYYCIRAKINSSIKIWNNNTYNFKYIHFSDLSIQKHHSKYYKNICLGDFKFKCNLAISRAIATSEDDPWFILTNIEPNKALREYAHRFGGIETVFKSQKTNGFNLEKTHTRNINAFENMYSLMCFAQTWLIIIGVDYTKNYNNFKHRFNIPFTKTRHGKKIRIISFFNLGLTIFKAVFSNHINFIIKCNMKLYL